MAEFSFPFDVSVAGDRTVTADTFGTMLNAIATNGVVKDADNGLEVTQSGTPAMSVAVNTGRAFVGHNSKRRFYRNTASLTLTIEAADSSNPRDDLIVLEMKEATGTRSVSLAVVKGSAAGSPSDPSLTQTEATYQHAIARVRVGTSVSTIVNANITDLRATNGYAGVGLAMGEISQLATDTIATGDFIGFSDESETGDPSNKITVDNLMETGLPLVTEDTVAVASDYMVFLDGGATGNANKESIAHFVSAIAGTNLSESSGQLVATDTNTTYTAGDGMDLSGTTFLLDLKSNAGLEISSTELSVAQGISQYDVAQFTSGVADDDFLKIDGTTVEGRSASEVLSDISARGQGTENMWVPAQAMTPRDNAGCASLETVAAGSSGQPDFHVLDFDKDTTEFAQFSVAMPKSWDGGNIYAYYYWIGIADANEVRWDIQVLSINNDEELAQAYGSAVSVTDTSLNDVTKIAISPKTGAIACSGADNDLLCFQVSRDHDHADDDMAGDARLWGILFEYTTNASTDA